MKFKFLKRFKFIAPIVILAAIGIAILLATTRNWSGMVERMEKTLGEQSVSQASVLCDKINGTLSLLDGLATTYRGEDLSDEVYVLDTLEQYAQKTDFVTVSYVNDEGHLYRSDGKELDVSDRWYFESGMKGEDFVALFQNPEMDASAKIAMGVPVRKDGEICGVLIGTYDKDVFREIFTACIPEGNAHSYLCSADGKFIVGTEYAEQEMERYIPGFSQIGNFFVILENSDFTKSSAELVKQTMKAGVGGLAAYSYCGEKRYTTYEPVGVVDWYLVKVLPEEQIYTQAIKEASFSYILLAVIMIVIIGMIMLLAYYEHRQALKEKRRVDEIRYRLEHDDLTGIYCEKVFLHKVEERLRMLEPDEYCIVYLDIFKFKLINEMFGYEKGDELLCVLADDLSQLAWEHNGLCGRISGDKFVLFVPHKEEIISLFAEKRSRSGKILPIDIYLHYGVYVIKDMSIPADRMVDYAQLAQKRVKGDYGNYISYYNEEIRMKFFKEQEIISSMTQALEDGEFVIYLQPQYNYRQQKITGAEALVRWKHPEKGLISPGEFIPVFETNGFIIKLDENVWEQVCKLQRKWIDEGKTPLPISVNVSRADLLKGAVAEKLTGLIKKYGLTSDLIRVEVTETAYMDNPQQLVAEIDALRKSGLLVEMDDFGSGYSSLNMLKDLPIQVLKTDLKFLAGSGIEMRKERILGGIISMAHQMGMLVIAEGVETKEQADYLLDLQCENMQGFYFARPMPVDEFEKIVYEN
ncbi:MAG: EAL domain-containing protein [Lachnospiraceae bacterium]|nr:EAL domain-containing protein [Lachnospiraceae bacterium]